MIKAVILDLDGTLCYTIDDLRTSMNAMLSERGYPTRSTEQILSAINCGSREFVRGSMPDELRSDEEELTRCHESYTAHYEKHYLDSTYPYPGIPEVLDKLKSRGLALAVLSNKGDSHTKALIAKLFAPGTFDIVLGNCGLFPTKPEPDSALYIAEKLGVRPQEVLYVGDSNVDMQTARNAGFFACGVTWGYRDAPVLIASGASVLVSGAEELALLV